MKNIYFAGIIKACDYDKETGNMNGNIFTVLKVSRSKNIKAALDNPRVIVAHYCDTKKDAERIVDAWIEANGSELQKRFGSWVYEL